MDANLQSIQPVLYETDEDEFSRQPSVKTTTTYKQVKKKRSTVQGKIQDYKLAYFSLWWSRMFREGKKEDEERLSRERVSRMRNFMTAWRYENDCDNVPLPEFGGGEMVENDYASRSPTDDLNTFVSDNISFCDQYSHLVGEMDIVNRGDSNFHTTVGGDRGVLSDSNQVISGGTQTQEIQMQYMDNTRILQVAKQVFSVSMTGVRRGENN